MKWGEYSIGFSQEQTILRIFVCDNALVLTFEIVLSSMGNVCFPFYTLHYMIVKDRSVVNNLIHSNINRLFLLPFCGNPDRGHSYIPSSIKFKVYCTMRKYYFFLNNCRKTSESYKKMFSLFHITLLGIFFF